MQVSLINLEEYTSLKNYDLSVTRAKIRGSCPNMLFVLTIFYLIFILINILSVLFLIYFLKRKENIEIHLSFDTNC